MECKKCNKKDPFLLLNNEGICYQCEKEMEDDITKLVRSIITVRTSYVGGATNDYFNKDYYVYQWRIKDTGEIFYIGKGRGNRAYSRHDRAYEAEKIKEKFNTEVVIIRKNLSEEEALQLENDEIVRILNETTHRLTNRVVPTARRDNGYSRANTAPKYEFEKATQFFASEIDEHYFGIKHKEFDEVNSNNLFRPYFIDKSLWGEEVEVVYGGKYKKYLKEVEDALDKLGIKPIKTRFAKSVTCWIYSIEDYVVNHNIDQKLALERVGRKIPSYHLIDVWKFLKNKS